MVNGQVGGSEAVGGVVEGVGLGVALDEDGAADGDGGLGADDRHDVLAPLLVADFLQKDLQVGRLLEHDVILKAGKTDYLRR